MDIIYNNRKPYSQVLNANRLYYNFRLCILAFPIEEMFFARFYFKFGYTWVQKFGKIFQQCKPVGNK